jgi:hypothetical protein
MRILTNSFRAMLWVAVAILPGIAEAYAQKNPKSIALKSGESVDLRNFFFIVNCRSALIGKPEVEVLDGPDEVTLSFREEMVLPRAYNCPKPVPGGIVVATAKEIAEPVEAKLTFRLKYNTKMGERQSSDTYVVSLFPGTRRTGNSAHSTPPTNPSEPTQSGPPQ